MSESDNPAPEVPAVALTTAPAAPPPKSKWWRYWQRLGGRFLVISIVVHVIFGAVATYLIVQRAFAPRKPVFHSGPRGPNAPTRALEHKVAMKKQNVLSAPPQARRVTTTGFSKVALPEMPAMPSMSAALSPGTISGMGAAGLAPGGLGGGGVGGMGGNGGAPINFFGARTGGAGLAGTFYDYKMDQGYQPIKGMDTDVYGKLVRQVLPTSGSWRPEQPRHFMSPAKLAAKYFMYPAIQDNEAGAAFQSPRSGPGSWLAVYRGSVSAPASGLFRFVGFGDNVMIVKLGNRIVLDASDHGYTGAKREAVGNVAFPGKDNTPLFAGDWVDFTAGEAKDIEIAVGDEGGIFCSGLFVQPKGMDYTQGERGVPKLPVFMLGAPSAADRELLSKAVPAECLQGPYFQNAASRSFSDIFGR